MLRTIILSLDSPLNAMSADRPSTLPWPPLILILCAVAAWALNRFTPLQWPGLDDGPARFVGYGFGVIGVVLVAWGIASLKRHDTTFLPHEASTTLVTTGPFQVLRNPIYLGDVFVFFGLAEMTKNIWFVIFGVVFALAVTWLAILPEEAHLEARFGDAYRDYRAKTRRWI